MTQHKKSLASIVLAILAVVLLAWQIPALEFDYNFEKFFPLNDPDLAFYKDFTDEYGYDNDYLIIALKGNEGIFDTAFVKEARRFSQDLGLLDGTKEVISPITFKKLVKSPMGYIPMAQFHEDSESSLFKDSLRISRDDFMRDMFFSKNLDYIKLSVVHRRFGDFAVSDAYLDSIHALVEQFQFADNKVVGRIVAQKTFIHSLKTDFQNFLVISFVLVTAMLSFFMRRASLVIMSLAVSGLSIIATLGLIAYTGGKIDVLTTLIPTILLVVSMSDIIHLFAQIRFEYSQSGDKIQSIKTAVKKVGLATFLTSITTAIGFLSLTTIRVQPVITLGLYSASGILIAFAITYLIFPQVMNISRAGVSKKQDRVKIKAFLRWTSEVVFNHPKAIIYSTIAVCALIVLGLSNLRVDAYLLQDLPNNSQVKRDFYFFDQEFGGSKPFSLSINRVDTTRSLYSKEAMIEMDKLLFIADSIFQVNSLISPVTQAKLLFQSLNGGRMDMYRLPKTDKEWSILLRELHKLKPWKKVNPNATEYRAQVAGFDRDIGSASAERKTAQLTLLAEKHVDSSIIDFQLTGTTVLINKSNKSLSYNLLQGIFMAVLVVAFLSGVLFRSFKMILITLLPNLIPILAVGAAMGFLGIHINMGTSVIFAISFGIVVDDSIHFLSKFKLELNKGHSIQESIKTTIMSTGEAIIITTIVLTIGFVVFCFSSFKATFYIGLFVSISFVVAVLADLLLLPLLISKFIPDKRKNS